MAWRRPRRTSPIRTPRPIPVGEEFRGQSDFLVKTAGAAVAYHPSRNNWGPLVVPGEQYFVLGDNRDNSLDSRYWGFVPDSLLRGRPEVVYFSFAPDSTDFAWLTHVRWMRLGEGRHLNRATSPPVPPVPPPLCLPPAAGA